MTTQTLVLLAGPNGAGKTIFAAANFRQYISAGRFLNADNMARDLQPENVEQAAITAGRNLLSLRRQAIELRQSFVLETTLASLTLMRAITEAKDQSFAINLRFLWVTSSELCDFRVKQRVMRGGHSIPTEVIRRHYFRGLALLPRFLEEADRATIYLSDGNAVTIATKSSAGLKIHDARKRRALQHTIAIAATFK